ncbi:polysaccharide biosynthesis protein [Ignisphaera aggregans DSM 17230]|uniref:Polysaccharide biosynthesis protein n=1 Tax=Ignisphaera aggregans (strain DSM 17230 / JCM 13409 / AQ1.S1) TaxID=583356 RepID=E0SR83_IGNAA|nr:polysaccharide biosynthesis protein [Ignisphaera aggregans DSM 17230]
MGTNSINQKEYILDISKTSARNAFYLFIGDFSYNFILAIGSIIIARMLGPEGYGIFSLSLVPPIFLVSVTSLGIDTAILRYVHSFYIERKYDDTINIIKTGLLIRTSIGLLLTIICYSFSLQLAKYIINRPDVSEYIRITSVVALLQSLYPIFLNIFIGIDNALKASLIKISYSTVKTIASIAFLLLGLGVIGALLGNIIGYVFAIAVGIYMLIRIYLSLRNNQYRANWNKNIINYMKILLVYGLPLYVGGVIGVLLGLYQNVLLAYNLSDNEIGGFRAMANLSTLVTVVSIPISTALLTLFTKVSTNNGDLNTSLAIANKYSSIVILPITILSMILSREIMYIFYGSEYIFISGYLPLYLAPNLLVGIGSISIPSMFNGIGDTKRNMYISTINAVIFIPIAYFMTIKYKLHGYLIASIISGISSSIAGVLLAKKYVDKPIDLRTIAPIYLASIISIIPLIIFLRIPLPLPRFISVARLLIGAIIYLVTFVVFASIFRGINERDVNYFEEIFKGIPLIEHIIHWLASIARIVFSYAK